jgi:hypothetical protein
MAAAARADTALIDFLLLMKLSSHRRTTVSVGKSAPARRIRTRPAILRIFLQEMTGSAKAENVRSE